MKITKEYLRKIIKESLEEAGGYIDNEGNVQDYPSSQMPTRKEGFVYLVVDFYMDEIIYATSNPKVAKKIAEEAVEEASNNNLSQAIRVIKLQMGQALYKGLKELPGANQKL